MVTVDSTVACFQVGEQVLFTLVFFVRSHAAAGLRSGALDTYLTVYPETNCTVSFEGEILSITT